MLWLAAIRLLWPREVKAVAEPRDPPILIGALIGAGIGLLSGLTGTGGGIFLSPVLLFMGWSNPRMASGVAAVFILCNSLAGLSGNMASVEALPASLPLYAGSVLAGAVVGTTLGIRLEDTMILKRSGWCSSSQASSDGFSNPIQTEGPRHSPREVRAVNPTREW